MGHFSIDADHQKRRRGDYMQRSLALVAALAAAAAQAADAYASYVKLIPNGGNVPDSPNIGHLSADGTTGLNDFGEAYEKAGNEWTTALCQEDTDGDGYTNGQELGDPCCTWTTSNTAGLITSGISHPSDASKTPTNAELTAGCSTTTTAGSSNSTTGGDDVNDVLAPVSAGSSSAMPQDDDEDDSDEMAETSNAPRAAVSAALALVATLAAAVAL